jgi:hypothetical protein
MYSIKQYTYDQANKLGLDIYPSKRKHKKIDVYKNNEYLGSVGDNRYYDYPTYLEINKELAEKKRKLYRQRHQKDLSYTKGYLAYHLLW